MAIANYFYNQTTRKYVALFGTYFNQLQIVRVDNQGNITQRMIVPISYAPWQKVLALATQKDVTPSVQMTLPRMSFEITGYTFDPSRKISPTRKIRKTVGDTDTGARNFHYSGAPYDISFSLYIMTKYNEDAVQLVEQIVPFFNPDLTQTARIVPGLDPLDIPLVLNDISSEEIYEGAFTESRSILWTLNFTMKAWYFGPEREKKVIKFVEANLATDVRTDVDFEEQQTIQPGLTANNEPTTVVADSVPYLDVNFDDPYGFAQAIENFPDP